MRVDCKEVEFVNGKPEWHVPLGLYSGYVSYAVFFESHQVDVSTIQNGGGTLRIILNPNVDHTKYSLFFSFPKN